MQFLSLFPNTAKTTYVVKNADLAELGRCLMESVCLLDLLYLRYTCDKFHHCGICITNVR